MVPVAYDSNVGVVQRRAAVLDELIAVVRNANGRLGGPEGYRKQVRGLGLTGGNAFAGSHPIRVFCSSPD